MKPLGAVDDVYREPLALELPESDSVHSELADSSLSSGRSSPCSFSTTNIDSEADFARMAENLALKTVLNVSGNRHEMGCRACFRRADRRWNHKTR